MPCIQNRRQVRVLIYNGFSGCVAEFRLRAGQSNHHRGNSPYRKNAWFLRPSRRVCTEGGHGSHPRSEMRDISEAIAGLFRPEVNSRRSAEPQPRPQSAKVIATVHCSSEVQSNRKPSFTDKPWARLDQALRATDLLLQNGGFGAIVLDMGSVAPEHALRVPLATWFRYRAVAEQKQTSLVLLMQHPCAKSSAGLRLRLLSGSALREESTVFTGVEYCVEVVRERFAPPLTNVIPLRKPPQNQKVARWQSRTAWTSR
jgi:recombination protein RecA